MQQDVDYRQLPLAFKVNEFFTFDNFSVGQNSDVINQLQQFLPAKAETDATQSFIYLWGSQGVGVSHLLQASCQYYSDNNFSTMYLPLESMLDLDTSVLEGVEAIDLLCIDHLERVAVNAQWQEALFHLFNRLQQRGSALLVGAEAPATALDIELADLVSRMTSGITYQVHELEDDDKIALVIQRAEQKGLTLKPDAAQFILNRENRQVSALLKVLDKLDRHSLSANRRLTIPFIKQVLSW